MADKTFNISEKLWKKVTKDKLELDLKTHEEVIWHLYEIAQEIKIASLNKGAKIKI
jgi:hypothetical protein